MKIIVLCFYLCLTQRPNFIGIGVVVQDRILYDVHNTRELMIMQMREKREASKREVKSDPAGTHADLEITERCRQDFGGCADLD